MPENGFSLSLIHSAGLKNVGLTGKIKGLATLPQKFVGGAADIQGISAAMLWSVPGLCFGAGADDGAIMGIPTLVMDSNALPGFTNRRLARFVDKAALTFEEAMPFFGKKGVVTGNPVRKSFLTSTPRKTVMTVTAVLIFGGSQGARAINNAMIGALDHLERNRRERCTSLTRRAKPILKRSVRHITSTAWEDADVRPYISDMVR